MHAERRIAPQNDAAGRTVSTDSLVSKPARTNPRQRAPRLRVMGVVGKSYAWLMKVGISVPHPVFREAEQAARRLRIPRSQLYARALQAYLKQQERPDITEQLNQVYGKRENRADSVVLDYNRRMLETVEWNE